MTGGHGCGGWKKSKKTKGFFKRMTFTTQEGKVIWYTRVSTRTAPERRRGIDRSWRGAMQKGYNVYVQGFGTFIHKRGYPGDGQQTFEVLGHNASEIRQFFENLNMPYNKIYVGGGKEFVKVPYGILYDMGWPWSRSLGYPTKYVTYYWIWEEGDANHRIVTEAEYWAWYEYIDIIEELNAEELTEFQKDAARIIYEGATGSDQTSRMIRDVIENVPMGMELDMPLSNIDQWIHDNAPSLGEFMNAIDVSRPDVVDAVYHWWYELWEAFYENNRLLNEFYWRAQGHYDWN